RQALNPAVKTIEPVFSFSKTDKNILFIMADNSANGFIPVVFNDFPQLKDDFTGFTLYSNNASFANHTLMAVPPLWGGYDFTPVEMNKRDTVPLVQKHNQALLMLPTLLSESGFHVTVTDPSWANYAWTADNSIFDGLKDVTAFNMQGNYTQIWYEQKDPEHVDLTPEIIKRNIVWFSLLKIMLPQMRSIIYDTGWYWGTGNIGSSILDFINAYSVLDYLPQLTQFNADKPQVIMFTNEMCHKTGFLKPPEYMPSSVPYKIGDSQWAENGNYHDNVALYQKLGLWFEQMKENGVYDNTRIIIAADHGNGIEGLIPGGPIAIKGENREKYNPVLMVKDFNQDGPFVINKDDFMTNADMPTLMLQGIIDNPVNPFTGNPINSDPKKDGIYITTNHVPMADGHGKYTFSIQKDQWIFLKDSIFDPANWQPAER
ncbi:MAG: sulfatase-like hydrolase/transferase, partial [Treponema sp.]|nr:sulfatase-like hydrolase/transferase [Treponema sp.]